MDQSFITTKSNLATSFPIYGPDFEFQLEIIQTETTTSQWNNIFSLTTGNKEGELGTRFPSLFINKFEGTQDLVLIVYFNRNEHHNGGYALRHKDIQLNTPYQIYVSLKNQVLSWSINGDDIEIFEMAIPFIFEDVKLWWDPFPGRLSYFSITSDSKPKYLYVLQLIIDKFQVD